MRSTRLGPRLAGAALALAGLLVAGPALAKWEPAATIDNPASSSTSAFGATYFDNALTVGSDGVATALFFQKGPATPSSVSFVVGSPFAVRRPAGAGTSWSTPAAIQTPSPGQADSAANAAALASVPASSGSGGGALGLFGFDPSSGGKQILATNWPASAAMPNPAVPVLCTSGAQPECADPSGGLRVAFDGQGTGYAVGATASTGADILFARTDPSTGAWQPAVVVAKQASDPVLAVDAAGNVVIGYVVATGTPPSSQLLAQRELAGATTFGKAQPISAAGDNLGSRRPALVIDKTGTATFMFLATTNTQPTSQSAQAVRWALTDAMPGAEQPLSTVTEGGTLNLALAVDPQNRVTAAWDAAVVPGASSIYSSQFDPTQSSAAWTTAQQVSPAASSGNTDSFSSPQLAADAAGTVTLIAQDSPGPNSSTLLVAWRKPLGQPWPAAPTVLSSSDTGAGSVAVQSYHVAASKAYQADVTFVQALNSVNRLFATRFTPTLTVTITTPKDGATFTQGAQVNADYSCAETDGPGIASCTGPAANGQPIDTATPGDKTFTVTATDKAGFTASQTANYTVTATGTGADTTPPIITITTPADGATYTQGQNVLANYSCTDNSGGSGVKSCSGSVPNGQPIDTQTAGMHKFTVNASDNAGNTASKTVNYSVQSGGGQPVPRNTPSGGGGALGLMTLLPLLGLALARRRRRR